MIASVAHWKTGEKTAFATIGYTRDNAGNPTAMGSTSYTYDANNRLDSATGFDYNYDWVGNRLNPPASPNPMVYDATDKLLLWPGQQSFKYHPTGSLKEQWNAAGSVLNKTWTYTGAELVDSVDHRDVSYDSVMAWDADSNRVSFTSSNTDTTWDFVYDTTSGIPAVIEEVTPSGSVYYIREPGGALIARTAGATTSYYHFDELGSTKLLTNGSGTVTDTYTYDAWGKQTASTGSTDQPYRYVGRLGYYSHYQDTNLFNQSGYQFLQLGVRFYDALTGRFTQRDPVARREEDAYAYGFLNPLAHFDPLGLYNIKKSCKSCKRLPRLVDEANKAMRKPVCKAAIDVVGCGDYIKPNFPYITFDCQWHDTDFGNRRGECRNSHGIVLYNCQTSDANGGSLLHEYVHACWHARADAGNIKPMDPSDEAFACPIMGENCTTHSGWGPPNGRGDPKWEEAAEKVKHACGF